MRATRSFSSRRASSVALLRLISERPTGPVGGDVDCRAAVSRTGVRLLGSGAGKVLLDDDVAQAFKATVFE